MAGAELCSGSAMQNDVRIPLHSCYYLHRGMVSSGKQCLLNTARRSCLLVLFLPPTLVGAPLHMDLFYDQ